MPTYTALTTLSGKDAAQALADAVEALEKEPYGVGVFEIEDGSGLYEVGGYFVDAPDGIALDLLAKIHGAKSFVVSVVPDKDWVAEVRRELAPIVAGRFYLYGSHDADTVPDDKVPLLIDAAMAFGTGHHGTTKGCLLALDALENQGFVGRNVIDVGCGTAVLAMAAAKIWDDAPLASDIDEVATETALANLRFNNMEGKVEVVTCAGFDHETIQSRAPYDLIFANILKGPLIALAPEMGRMVDDGGYIILSGILNTQAAEVIETYASQGIALITAQELGEWTTLTLQKAT